MNIVQIKPSTNTEPDFETFWSLYPKKIEKSTAREEWNKLSLEDRRLALEALPAHTKMWAERGDPHFILYACRWLKRRRFEDELECALQVTFCGWKGCKSAGTSSFGRGVFCDQHAAALKRGETP